ncbi:carboxymuconolactone decarboxylase family protein [Azospirillum sp. SYSU D00513]|uniref:carboxymuconolactone decarboxylase family protein n=1 Tax=Azospirillum sp. SYSU D00513 TaxID=2812561 RepID=UPI001A96CE1D|nr:carboxymuconolactone decarboxylase family protein [Azospirillum sp. SYSU D00513]
MSIDALRGTLPDYAKDLKLNLSTVLTSPNLTPQQAWGTAVASAIASRNDALIKAVAADAVAHLEPAAFNAAKAAAAIMGMNNIYYRFVHLSGHPDFKTLPARLRMNIIGNPGVDKLDFEMWSLGVSAVNGCGMCIEAHEREVLGKGATKEAVQDVVRIAAVLHAVAVTLDAERALAS